MKKINEEEIVRWSVYAVIAFAVIILLVLSKHYPSLVNAWKNVGTIEDDKMFVIRNPGIIGTYWDIEQNRVI